MIIWGRYVPTVQVGTAVLRAPESTNDSLSSIVGPFPAEVYRYLDSRQRKQAIM